MKAPFFMKDQGVLIWPPLQPWDKKTPELKHTSCEERGTIMAASVAMHMRSDAASAPAKAQQHPQLDWSRMSPMIFAHWGHFSAESKLVGISRLSSKVTSLISPCCTKSLMI